MLPSLLYLCFLVISCLAMPPPPGLNLKPAKEIGSENTQFETPSPPNLRLRSRMMAALNAVDTKADRIPIGSQPLILTKNRKHKKASPTSHPMLRDRIRASVEMPPLRSDQPTARPKRTEKVPSSANFSVNSLLQTNFVDSSGRVLKNVRTVPIRVGEGTRKYNSSSSYASEKLDGDNKNVEVRFGEAPVKH